MSHDEALHFRLPGGVKQRWAESCDRKKINQTTAILALLEFYLAQDELAQSMMLGQIPAVEDVIEVVLKRIQPRGKR